MHVTNLKAYDLYYRGRIQGAKKVNLQAAIQASCSLSIY